MLPEKEYEKLKMFLTTLMAKSDGSATKFARKYGVKKYTDFYAIFERIKKELKNDREALAFAIMKDMAKTYVGRVWMKMPGEDPEAKVFNAWSATLDYIAIALDDLKVLQKALMRMQSEKPTVMKENSNTLPNIGKLLLESLKKRR